MQETREERLERRVREGTESLLAYMPKLSRAEAEALVRAQEERIDRVARLVTEEEETARHEEEGASQE